MKPLSSVTQGDINNAVRIEAVTRDGESAPEMIWFCRGKPTDTSRGPCQPYGRSSTLVVHLPTKEDLPTLVAMVSDATGAEFSEEDDEPV